MKKLIQLCGLSGAMTVALGAIGAHYLKSKIDTGQITIENLQTFETAVRYQMFHTLALFILSILMGKLHHKLINFAAYFFVAGIILFSGSLYLLSLRVLLGIENWHWLGPITPLGGLCFITGWILVFIAAMKINAN